MLNYFEIRLTEKEPFLDAMKNRILLFDGAMGTEIQRHDPLRHQTAVFYFSLHQEMALFQSI